MHTAYENFITKRVVSIFVSAVFKAPDLVSYNQIIEHKKEIDDYLGTVKFIEKPKDIKIYLTKEMTSSRVKAVDVKAFSHIFPLYFLPLAEELNDIYPLTPFQFLVISMIELNAYVIALVATNVPLSFVDNNGRNEMNRSYIKLILKL